jgi:hypothetical protein
MNERKLQHGSAINTADEATLEGAVGPSIFESLDDGPVRKGGRANVGRTGGAPMWVWKVGRRLYGGKTLPQSSMNFPD